MPRAPKRDPGLPRFQPFAGACLLTGAMLLPHAPATPVLAGMVLAGAILWAWNLYRRSRQP